MQVKARGEPDAEDGSVAALLLRLRDPATGAPLPDNLLAAEFGVFFTAGIESAGHAITWALCAPSQQSALLSACHRTGTSVVCWSWPEVPSLPAPRGQGCYTLVSGDVRMPCRAQDATAMIFRACSQQCRPRLALCYSLHQHPYAHEPEVQSSCLCRIKQKESCRSLGSTYFCRC